MHRLQEWDTSQTREDQRGEFLESSQSGAASHTRREWEAKKRGHKFKQESFTPRPPLLVAFEAKWLGVWASIARELRGIKERLTAAKWNDLTVQRFTWDVLARKTLSLKIPTHQQKVYYTHVLVEFPLDVANTSHWSQTRIQTQVLSS